VTVPRGKALDFSGCTAAPKLVRSTRQQSKRERRQDTCPVRFRNAGFAVPCGQGCPGVLLYFLCFKHVDNLGAYSLPPQTGLLPRKTQHTVNASRFH
jgi:hypothetical protein